MARQAGSENPIDIVERIWSEKLDGSLIEKILQSPADKLNEFLEEYNHMIHAARAPQLDSGVLRPEIRRTYLDGVRSAQHHSPIQSGLRLLLYTHEVLVDDPFDLNRGVAEGGVEGLRTYIVRTVRELVAVRPLVEEGVMRFALLARARHPAFSGDEPGHVGSMTALLQTNETLHLSVRELAARHGVDELLAYQYLIHDVYGSIKLLRHWTRVFTPLMHGAVELEALGHLLGGISQGFQGGRSDTISKLASISMPHLAANAKQLIEIRRSEETFAEWRSALNNAARDIQDLSERDETWASHAREILLDGLEPVRAKAKANLKKSRFLTRTSNGIRGFTFAGLGAAAGSMAVGGSMIGGIVGAASAKSVEFLWDTVNALRERRRDKAVLDLIIGLEDIIE